MSMVGKQQYIWRREGSTTPHAITARDPQHAMSALVAAARVLNWSGRFEFFAADGSSVGLLYVSAKGRCKVELAERGAAV